MARVNIFLTDELLKEIDAEAANSRLGRSSLVQLAMRHFLEARHREREEVKLRGEMVEAGRGMDELAAKLGIWDPVRVIREFRENRAVGVHEPKPRYKATKGRAGS